MILAHITWPEIEAARSRVCVVPLGSLEQHGLHLPLWTDTAIVSEIARRAEQRLPGQMVLAPVQTVGYSPHHAHFGCMSMDLTTYVAMIRNLCRTIHAMGFQRIFLLNGHGGNDVPCRAAMCEIKVEMPELRVAFASYWSLASPAFQSIRSSERGGMGHACEMETSVMLSLYPDQVHVERAVDDGPVTRASATRVPDMLQPPPYYMVRDFHEISDNGTIGRPSHAQVEKGALFLNAAVDAVCALITSFAAGEMDN